MEAINQAHPYYRLGPADVLDAVESMGLWTNGRFLALNSYENRVYQVGIEDQRPVVVKFYRPGRWSDEAILEEHAFTWELAELEIPVVPPMRNDNGETLHQHGGFRFAVFASVGGRAPELDDPEHLEWMGRYIGRIHQEKPFMHRPRITVEDYLAASGEYLLSHDFIPPHLRHAYENTLSRLVDVVEAAFQRAGSVTPLRLHGDCHPGNVLWTQQGPKFVDFDDTRMGPAVQDLWMFISGSREEMALQLSTLLEGYEAFRDFNRRELHLVEALRAMRVVFYSAWLARRWQDPAFPQTFPWFNTEKYWEQHIQGLQEQVETVEQPPLVV